MKTITQNILLALAATVLSFMACELLLRCFGSYETYSERNKGKYISPYFFGAGIPRLLIRPPNSKVYDRCPEFEHELQINSEGVCDREHQVEKPDGVYRVLLLGDSFTEGIGARFEESAGQLLQKSYSRLSCGKQIEILMAGVSGSDPAFEYALLRSKFLKYRPDLVVVLTNRTDVEDFLGRGGMERFDKDGEVHFKERPFIEPLFQRSRLVRGVMLRLLGYDWALTTSGERWQKYHEATFKLGETLVLFRKLADEQHFQFVAVRHPTGPQLWHNPPFDDVLELLPMFRRFEVRFEDLVPVFRKRIGPDEVSEYYWPMNLHFRPAGYALLAEELKKILDRTPGFPECTSTP